MSSQLPQKYQEMAKALIPYTPEPPHQMALISFEPALPCFICNRPAKIGLVAPAPEQKPGAGRHWLTFPLCSGCEERQVHSQEP